MKYSSHVISTIFICCFFLLFAIESTIHLLSEKMAPAAKQSVLRSTEQQFSESQYSSSVKSSNVVFSGSHQPNPADHWLPQERKEFKVATSKSLPNSVLKRVVTPPRKVKPTMHVELDDHQSKQQSISEMQQKVISIPSESSKNINVGVETKEEEMNVNKEKKMNVIVEEVNVNKEEKVNVVKEEEKEEKVNVVEEEEEKEKEVNVNKGKKVSTVEEEEKEEEPKEVKEEKVNKGKKMNTVEEEEPEEEVNVNKGKKMNTVEEEERKEVNVNKGKKVNVVEKEKEEPEEEKENVDKEVLPKEKVKVKKGKKMKFIVRVLPLEKGKLRKEKTVKVVEPVEEEEPEEKNHKTVATDSESKEDPSSEEADEKNPEVSEDDDELSASETVLQNRSNQINEEEAYTEEDNNPSLSPDSPTELTDIDGKGETVETNKPEEEEEEEESYKPTKQYKVRFGSRFRLRYIKSGQPKYFPPDHVHEQLVQRYINTVSNDERRALNSMSSKLKPYIPHFLEVLNSSRIDETRLNDPKYTTPIHSTRFEKMVKKEEGETVCQGCKIKGEYKIRLHRGGQMMTYRKFIGNKEIVNADLNYTAPFINEPTEYNVTAIMVTTKTRLFFIKQLLYRWSGPMIIIVNGKLDEEKHVINYIRRHYLPRRLTLCLYFLSYRHPQSKLFPVNFLRNLAIRNVETTHYQIMDMDLWPTVNTYQEIINLPKQILSSPFSAVILPIFFFNKHRVLSRCVGFKQCALFGLNLMPENKTELEACILERLCEARKPNIRTHMYVLPDWYETPDDKHVARIRCFVNDFQEPYVLLRRVASTPLFYEKFVNYGYNKVQLIEHLRAAGFQFYLLLQAFAMDIPHVDSDYRRKYLLNLHTNELQMREVYAGFQASLNKNYSQAIRFPVCGKYPSRYLHIID